jgi:hypothetical protein
MFPWNAPDFVSFQQKWRIFFGASENFAFLFFLKYEKFYAIIYDKLENMQLALPVRAGSVRIFPIQIAYYSPAGD